MEQITARHQTMDMYNCNADHLHLDSELPRELPTLVESAGFHIVTSTLEVIDENHAVILLLLKEGHFAVHLYPAIRYVATDLFLCEPGAAPEKILQGLRKIFHPEKFRTTYLKRGDFTASTDMKPKIKTHMAPLRRIHNTGAKVIRLLAHRRR
ncbi:MAG: S-adenosylmethionine decarboxylase family protein [Schwartzia sp. (in: firmicutes)]